MRALRLRLGAPMRRLPTRLPMHSMCRGLATQPSLLTFGEVMLTYKPAPGAEPIATGVSHVVQAVGGSELNVAAAYAQLDGPGSRSSSWVSIFPEGPMGDLVMSTADTLGVATEHVQRAADSDIGTLHVVDDGSGPRPHFQRRQSAFCTQSSAETFPWSELLAKPNWYFLSGITPLLTAGARAAWNASLDALPAASSAGTPPYVCLDVNYRPALGSFDDLWAVIKPQLSRVTFLMLSGDTLEKLATAEGCWEAPKADETLYDVQVKALSAVRDRWGVPLVGCSFKRPVAADAAATGGGRQKTVIFGGGTRRWSTVAFEGGVASTAEMPIEHAPIQALGGGDAWMAGFIHCLNSRAFAGCAAYPLGELTSLLQAACRRGDLIAAMHMRTHGDMSSVQGAELFEVEASCAGKPHVVPPLPEPTATSTIAASGEGCGLPTAKWDAVNASLNSVGIVPVVTIQDLAHAVPVAKALVAGGINCIELTLRSEVAEACLEKIAQEVPSMLIGAGTVLTTAQAERAVTCGAHFLVSPGTNEKVVRWSLDHDVPILPGVATASEVEAALEMGLRTIKFFPAESNGGLNTIKALAGPYGGLQWMPTGGISPTNCTAYLQNPNILCVGGSWLVPASALESGDYGEITKRAQEAVEIVKAARGK